MQDLAFVPIQVILVTLILNRFLNVMEERKKRKKINVIISTFFAEAGTCILAEMHRLNRQGKVTEELLTASRINAKNGVQLKRAVKERNLELYADPDRLPAMYTALIAHKPSMLRMLENSNLLEHESFTDMLWAVFHVADELQHRGTIDLSSADIDHLSNDFTRAYSVLLMEWVDYMIYLHDEYPFLYALALSRNPLSTKERPIPHFSTEV